MSNELIGLIGVILIVALIMGRVWVGVAMALVGFVGLGVMIGFDRSLQTLGVVTFTNASVYPITAVPMFSLMGMVIAETNIGRNLYIALYRTIGRFRGGLASATVATCGILGAVTGSENVATVIMTKIALKPMREFHYDDELSTASISAGAPLAIIIPPSLGMILFGTLTESSVSQLFIGGIIPGLMMIVLFVAAINFVCRLKPGYGPAGPKFSFKEQIQGLVGVLPMVILIVLVLGSIYGGVCTTTEAGSVGAVGAIIIAFVSKQMNFKRFLEILRETVSTVGTMLLIICGTYVFIQFLNISQLPQLMTNWVTATFTARWAVILMICVLYVILGMLMPQMCMMILTIPLLWPAMNALGFDIIWFGVFVVMMQALGSITPPVGLVSFMVSGFSGVPAGKVFKGLTPFLVMYLIVIVLCCVFPGLITWLPSHL